MKRNILCPVCEKYTFDEENDFDICNVCGWENDGVQGSDFDYSGGANALSVNEYKIFYELSLCDIIADKLFAVKKEYEEKRSSIFKKYKNIDWRIDGDNASRELKYAHDKYVNELLELYEDIHK